MVEHTAGRHNEACTEGCLHARNFLLTENFQDRQIASAVKRDTVCSFFFAMALAGDAGAAVAAAQNGMGIVHSGHAVHRAMRCAGMSGEEQLMAFIKSVPWEGK